MSNQSTEQNVIADAGLAALPSPPAVRGALRQVPLRVCAAINVHGFRLRDLKALRAGQLLVTQMSATDNVPVLIGGAAVAFAEMDNVDGQMALRLTRLS